MTLLQPVTMHRTVIRERERIGDLHVYVLEHASMLYILH